MMRKSVTSAPAWPPNPTPAVPMAEGADHSKGKGRAGGQPMKERMEERVVERVEESVEERR